MQIFCIHSPTVSVFAFLPHVDFSLPLPWLKWLKPRRKPIKPNPEFPISWSPASMAVLKKFRRKILSKPSDPMARRIRVLFSCPDSEWRSPPAPKPCRSNPLYPRKQTRNTKLKFLHRGQSLKSSPRSLKCRKSLMSRRVRFRCPRLFPQIKGLRLRKDLKRFEIVFLHLVVIVSILCLVLVVIFWFFSWFREIRLEVR